MADDDEDRRVSRLSDSWIELHSIPSTSEGNSHPHAGSQYHVPEPSSSQRPPLPRLRLDTSNLSPPKSERDKRKSLTPEEPAPKSAILGLAGRDNSGISNWLADERHSDHARKVSPMSSAKLLRRRSSNASSIYKSSASPSTSRHSRDRHERRASDASESAVVATESSPRLSPRLSPITADQGDRPTTPIPQLTLTVERSFQHRGQDTPLTSTDHHAGYFGSAEDIKDVPSSPVVESPTSEIASDLAQEDSHEANNNLLAVKKEGRAKVGMHESRKGSRNVSSESLLHPLFSQSPNKRSHSGRVSPTPQVHNLSLSGAAHAAQQDLLDAEEEDREVDTSVEDEGERNGDTWSSSSRSEYINDDMSVSEHGSNEAFVENYLEEPLGRTLFVFSATNPFRGFVFKIMMSQLVRYIEIALTIVQVVALSIEVSNPFNTVHGLPTVLNTKAEHLFIGLYSVFTLFAAGRCIAFGVVTNEVLTLAQVKRQSLWMMRRCLNLLTLGSIKNPKEKHISSSPLASHLCYLRKSWGRVEFLSMLFFWSMVGVLNQKQIYSLDLIVAGLGHLRILRLLDEFVYTRIVLHVIKAAIPLLQNVLIFIGFFLAVWGVIGLQSFNGSLRRICVYNEIVTTQHCGSWLDPETNKSLPYMLLDTARGTYQNQSTSKGYTCPAGSKCVEMRAFPPSGSFAELANMSFDNIFNSLEIVFIMMSTNGFTQIMYDVVDSEYLASSLFFITGVLVLGVWLMNLLVAVMVSSYASVRHQFDDTFSNTVMYYWTQKIWGKTFGRFKRNDESRESLTPTITEELSPKQVSPSVGYEAHSGKTTFRDRNEHGKWIMKNTKWGKRYSLIHPVFAVLAVIDLIVQAAKTPPEHRLFEWELSLAVVFGVEILVRFWVFLPYWRYFFFSITNLFDLTLAIANCVILPFYDHHELYAWLTVFQLLRVYRMIGALKYSRIFWLQVFGNFKALASLTAFFFSITFLCTLIATKMLRGQFAMKSDGDINTSSFYDLAVSFFSMYQIASTENWTDVLFWVTENVMRPGDNVVGLACMGILFCGWLFFANFLIFNLFVGIMSESLHGAISNKRGEQVRQFLDEVKEVNLNQRGPLFDGALNTLGESNEDEFIARPVKLREKIWGTIVHWFPWKEKSRGGLLMASRPIQAAVERQFVIEFLEAQENLGQMSGGLGAGKTFLSLPGDANAPYGFEKYAAFPFFKKAKVVMHKLYSLFHHYPEDYAAFVYQRLGHPDKSEPSNYRAYVEGMFDYNSQSVSTLDEYCQEHPQFDKPLFLFGRNNRIRTLCQRLVPSSNGTRLSGVNPKRALGFYIRMIFIAATVSLVVQTCVNTPLYALDDQGKDPNKVWTYSRVIDLVYGIIFTLEFLVKVIADGFHFTPNAYTWSPWNCLDFVVLISIWMTFINDLVNGVLSRYLRALLALRALRLISFFRQSELLLSSVFIYGLRNVLGACLITLSIVIPYAVWGKNIFHDRLKQCNDGSVDLLGECSGEYVATVFDNFEMLAPRVVQENYFNYNNFWQALLIQFGVLSLEGWVDVLQAVTSITGVGKQPSTYASKGNAVYPILYHYIGAVLIMTMLIAVIIRNYALTVGTAFLTEQQLSWLDVKRTLQLIKPTPKPPRYKYGSLRHHLLTIIPTWVTFIEVWALFVATVDMAAYFYPLKPATTRIYELIIIACSLLLVLLSLLRLIVLQPTLYFHNWWNPFGLLVSVTVTVLTIITYALPDYKVTGALAASRAADICLLLLWIPRTKKLYQFYAISTAAISEIGMLLRAWFVLYLTYAIAFNQSFGLTKLGSQSTWSKNFRTIPKALIALFTMSCGEGWNEFLIDFTLSKPYCIENSSESECGISGFAYFLFISWNILSMYVFANLFISLICEACWYLYRSGPVNISEQDIVSLLDTWQQFDPKGTGFIRTKELHNFLGRSQRYFSIGIYSNDSKYNVHRIVAETQKGTRTLIDPYDVDMDAIYEYLDDMNVQKYREKRILYELFATQAEQMSYAFPGGRGIRFSRIVLMFPLYQDMDPSETLSLKEFLALKVQLHEARLVLAANFIIRKWRLKNRSHPRPKRRSHKRESPGVGYDQSWTQSKDDASPVYWVT